MRKIEPMDPTWLFIFLFNKRPPFRKIVMTYLRSYNFAKTIKKKVKNVPTFFEWCSHGVREENVYFTLVIVYSMILKHLTVWYTFSIKWLTQIFVCVIILKTVKYMKTLHILWIFIHLLSRYIICIFMFVKMYGYILISNGYKTKYFV